MIPWHVFVYGILASIFGSIGALLLKLGAKTLSFSKPYNLKLVSGGVLYVIATIFFVLGLRDAPLSFFYTFTSLLYLFAALFGFFVLGEKCTKWKIAGLCLVLIGIALNSIGR